MFGRYSNAAQFYRIAFGWNSNRPFPVKAWPEGTEGAAEAIRERNESGHFEWTRIFYEDAQVEFRVTRDTEAGGSADDREQTGTWKTGAIHNIEVAWQHEFDNPISSFPTAPIFGSLNFDRNRESGLSVQGQSVVTLAAK